MINLLLVIAQLFFSQIHPFHVSVCDIEFSKHEKSLQLSQRVFIDDLEIALGKKYSLNLDVNDETTTTLLDSLIHVYMLENVHLIVDGKQKNATYIGNEIEGDGMWCYMEYTGIKKLKSLEIRNTVFLETFEDQVNIIHFEYEDYEKSIKLDQTKKFGVFNLEN